MSNLLHGRLVDDHFPIYKWLDVADDAIIIRIFGVKSEIRSLERRGGHAEDSLQLAMLLSGIKMIAVASHLVREMQDDLFDLALFIILER